MCLLVTIWCTILQITLTKIARILWLEIGTTEKGKHTKEEDAAMLDIKRSPNDVSFDDQAYENVDRKLIRNGLLLAEVTQRIIFLLMLITNIVVCALVFIKIKQ